MVDQIKPNLKLSHNFALCTYRLEPIILYTHEGSHKRVSRFIIMCPVISSRYYIQKTLSLQWNHCLETGSLRILWLATSNPVHTSHQAAASVDKYQGMCGRATRGLLKVANQPKTSPEAGCQKVVLRSLRRVWSGLIGVPIFQLTVILPNSSPVDLLVKPNHIGLSAVL